MPSECKAFQTRPALRQAKSGRPTSRHPGLPIGLAIAFSSPTICGLHFARRPRPTKPNSTRSQIMADQQSIRFEIALGGGGRYFTRQRRRWRLLIPIEALKVIADILLVE